ncbi:MAG TPA: DUF4835 family protein, partial [Cytophagales bacterium]|nr:DUF4835 family protein [Cytophagales bacterium]
VIVNTDQLQGSRLDKQLQTDMQTNISNFINTYKWTEHTYEVHEKINCTFQISITGFSGSRYRANVQVAASRPIYNTTYETQIFNFSDMDWEFDYSQSSAINYNENAYVNALSSLISYYVYLILAHDYDSFAKLGGQQYLEKAQQIMNSAQATDDKGWKQGDGNNVRYWIVENLVNPQQQVLREVNYRYHRMAMDKFANNPEKARGVVLKCLEDIKQMNVIRPNTLTMKWFFVMKYNELIQIFSKAPTEVKQKAFDVLREVDPTHINFYENILKNN